MAPDPADHWAYHTGRWVLAHGDGLLPAAFVLLLLLAGLLLALAWLQGGARLIVAVWVWRQALALVARPRRLRPPSGGRGGHRAALSGTAP